MRKSITFILLIALAAFAGIFAVAQSARAAPVGVNIEKYPAAVAAPSPTMQTVDLRVVVAYSPPASVLHVNTTDLPSNQKQTLYKSNFVRRVIYPPEQWE